MVVGFLARDVAMVVVKGPGSWLWCWRMKRGAGMET